MGSDPIPAAQVEATPRMNPECVACPTGEYVGQTSDRCESIAHSLAVGQLTIHPRTAWREHV